MTPHRTPPASAAAEAKPLVLVVDDVEDNRAVYAEYLSVSGYRVAQASDGLQAIEQARGLRPDVVVMDMSLPVMDGWEATRRLKADAATRAIPIVALTGHSLGGPHGRAVRSAGCDRVLSKPCLPEQLAATIDELLRAQAAETELHRANHDDGQ
jgi:CheY-like chemotaxis protein